MNRHTLARELNQGMLNIDHQTDDMNMHTLARELNQGMLNIDHQTDDMNMHTRSRELLDEFSTDEQARHNLSMRMNTA